MQNIEITAKSNPKIKELKALMCSNRERKKSGLFVLEGVRLCFDAVRSGLEIESIFYTEECENKFRDEINSLLKSANAAYKVTADVLKSVSDTVTPQGVICVLKMQKNTFTYEKGKKYIALDTVQNPDNLGATARTAEALGIDGLLVCGGCDIYNPKAQRASMGALLRLPVALIENLENEIQKFSELGLKVYATVPDSSALSITDADFKNGAVCIIGNEGNGIRTEILKKCERITIKMQGRAESLNAASAASIVMWELVK